jgi:hypothetical protein
MNTFFQAVGYIALSLFVLALLDMLYFKHFRWTAGYQAWTGKKGVHKRRGPRKRNQEYRDVLPEPPTPHEGG